MKFSDPLLAKSYENNGDIPPYARLVQHLRAVEKAAEIIVDVVGDAILIQAGLIDQCWKSRLIRTVKTAAVCHDVGKANVPFQQMVRGKLPPLKQPARHELIGALVLMDRAHPISKFALDCLADPADTQDDTDKLLCCVIGAVAGHHLKMDEEWKIAARALQGGCGQTLDLLFSHPDFKPLLRERYLADWKQSYSLIGGDANYLGDAQVAFRRLSNDWYYKTLCLSAEWWRFAGIVKALVSAADVVGSALLPKRGNANIAEWIRSQLTRTVTAAQLNAVAERKLGGNVPYEFQDRVRESQARVTLVRAGCGTGKTAAAYLWGARHADGKKFFFCYPTTGTATEGYLGYVHVSHEELESALVHSRALVDLDGIAGVQDEDKDESSMRVEALNLWRPRIIVCTADTVLGLVRNYRRALYNSPALLTGCFVFDEIHSYDATMFASLIQLIKALPGASFLLMSASLPASRRNFLREAIPDIADIDGPADLEKLDRYRFIELNSSNEALEICEQACRERKRVLWVCNTVECAQVRMGELEKRQISALTYHSRFKYKHRVNHHRKVVSEFGAEERSAGFVAVTTQVAEMSLDIDADILITEYAPIPSLIQRLGRLNRRTRIEEGKPAYVEEVRPAYFLQPDGPQPYKAELWMQKSEQWVRNFALNGALSQLNLTESFSSDQPEVINHRTHWLDTGWHAVPEPGRDIGFSVSVILAGDRDICIKSKKERLKRTIPMNYHSSMKGWEWFHGLLIAPPGAIEYNESGARLRT